MKLPDRIHESILPRSRPSRKRVNRKGSVALSSLLFVPGSFLWSRVSSMKLKRPTLVLVFVCWAASLCPHPPLRAEVPKRPNIIVILSDAQRADYLGSYGFEGDISPNLDKLARSSALFTRAIAQAPWTKPSVATIFTSLYARTHRVVDHKGRFWNNVGDDFKTSALPDGATTLAEVLQAQGYRTVAWVTNDWLSEELGFSQGFDHYHGVKPDSNIYHGEKILEPAWEWLEGIKQDERPFFLYLHFMDVHGPWRWSEKDYRALYGSPGLSKNTPPAKLKEHFKPRHSRDIDFPDFDTTLPSWRAVYGSRVRSLDRELGRFFEKLEGSGLMDTSVIVFTADHGEELMDHWGWGHSASLYAHQIWVPLIIRPPGGLKEGRRIDTAVSLIDVMPTLLTAAGVSSPPERMQGVDLWDAVVSKRPLAHPGWAFSGAVRQNARMVSVQDARHKLIWIPTPQPARHQLFDLEADPGERRNLIKENPALFERLHKVLEEHLRKLERTETLLEAGGTLTREEIEKLKALGYVN
jgi:arylsulfatase